MRTFGNQRGICSADITMVVHHRDNYDFDQISAISRVVFAALLTVAGFRTE